MDRVKWCVQCEHWGACGLNHVAASCMNPKMAHVFVYWDCRCDRWEPIRNLHHQQAADVMQERLQS